MPLTHLEHTLKEKLYDLRQKEILKGKESVITGLKPASGRKGPRYFIKGYRNKEFIRMNSNSYLGMSLRQEIIEVEESSARKFGSGPGAVRFISGTYGPHIELEKKLATFHNREAAMIFSSAYATVMGTLSPLIDPDTIIISDELNHNSIINAIKISRPKNKDVYKHLDMKDLESRIKNATGQGQRLVIITDGIFSMRGDYAPLDTIADLAQTYNYKFEDGIVTIADDSHGIGAFGKTGRGTEEYTKGRVDILIATLGKALGINGGYVTTNAPVIDYLRETAPFYIYSNPITPSEASAALTALNILDSDEGFRLLETLRSLTKRFENGLILLGYEIIQGDHPIVPIMIRNTEKTTALVQYLHENGILTTALKFPVVPRGDEEIRCQVSADHTEDDIDYVLDVLRKYDIKQK